MLLLSFHANSQLALTSSQNSMQESSEITWSKIENEKFKIIFPKENYQQARRVGNTLEAIWTTNPYGLGVKSTKIPFILRRQNVISNGYVAFGPFRSEFFTTPPHTPGLGTLLFLDVLL